MKCGNVAKMFFIFLPACVRRSPPDHTKPLDHFFGMLVISKQFIFQFLDSRKLGLTSFSALRCVNLDPLGVLVNGGRKRGKKNNFIYLSYMLFVVVL